MPLLQKFKKQPRQQRERQSQPQQNRDQAAPPAANSYAGGYPPQNAHQHSRLDPTQSLLEGPHRSGHRSGRNASRNSTQRTPEHRGESAAPVIGGRIIQEVSESRFREEDRRGASRHQIMDTTFVGQDEKSWNQMGSGDKGRQVLDEDYSNPETRSANFQQSDSKVIEAPGQSIKSPLSPKSDLQTNLSDKVKLPEANSPMLDMAEERHTGGKRLQRDDHKPGSTQSDRQNRDEAKYDESGRLRTGGIIRRPDNGEHPKQGRGKPTKLSTNDTDQVQHNKEMLEENHHKSIENARPNRSDLMTAHQNALQVLCDEKTGLQQVIVDNQKIIEELRSTLNSTKNHNIYLLQELESKSDNLKIAQQALEDSISDRSDLVKAHQNAIQVLCDEKTGLQQDIDDDQKIIEELRSTLKSTQDGNTHLWQELESKSDNLKIAQQALEKSISDISDVSTRLQSTREEADSLKQSKGECTDKIRLLEQSLAENGEQLAIFEQTQVHERSQHAKAIATLNQEIRTLKADFKEQVDSLIIRQKQETDQLRNSYKAEISRLVQEHNIEIDVYQQNIKSVKTEAEEKRQELEFTYAQQMDQLLDEHEITVAQMKAEQVQLTEEEEKKRQNLTAVHEKQRTQIFQEHEQALSRINEELAEVRQDKELKIQRLMEAHAAELAQKDVSYAQGTRQLREDIQRLNAALLTRDDGLYQGELFTTSNLPTRPDEQIRGKFSEIEQMVDDLGRLQWKPEPAVWTSEVLRSVGANSIDRVLKKAIVQDLVWCLLFNHIFCSPFRVFGAEGRLLEEEWNEQCGQDGDSNSEVFSWPEPGVKTERWRYMTVKECREVLRPPVPSDWDPRMRLRKGFMDNLKESVSELKASLEQIADLTPADIKMIDRLPKKAATVWLDFAMHRCRIVVRLKGSAALSMEDKVATALRSSLELTVIPAVGRYGNVRGADLDMYKTIDRCAGESIVIPS